MEDRLSKKTMKYRKDDPNNKTPQNRLQRVLSLFSKACCCPREKKVMHSDEITLLPPEKNSLKKTLVLDLDETLMHSSLVPTTEFDTKLEIKLEESFFSIYIQTRPWAFEFLEKVSELYEVVIFTASLKGYADPVIEFIDRSKVVSSRLFRNECLNYNGNYIKNLSLLGRDLKRVVIVDNSPISYAFHPHNAIAITSWFNDSSDRKLEEVYEILKKLSVVDNIPKVLKSLVAQKIELSPTNISAVINSYMQERSAFNSPKAMNRSKIFFNNDNE